MTINEARLIREIKKSCTYRYLAEVYYPKDVRGHGNQLFGQDLCREALEILYPNQNKTSSVMGESEEFDKDNLVDSFSRDFYWWE